ncbi:hypothetical protein PIB30_092558, partial [Stylosanthes scabra]|nr:hypothetical protein [Stylosanthes scabra]
NNGSPVRPSQFGGVMHFDLPTKKRSLPRGQSILMLPRPEMYFYVGDVLPQQIKQRMGNFFGIVFNDNRDMASWEEANGQEVIDVIPSEMSSREFRIAKL